MNSARKMGNVLGGIVESTNNGILPGILLGKCSLWKLPWEKISSQLSNDMTVTFHDKQMFSFKFHYLVFVNLETMLFISTNKYYYRYMNIVRLCFQSKGLLPPPLHRTTPPPPKQQLQLANEVIIHIEYTNPYLAPGNITIKQYAQCISP